MQMDEVEKAETAWMGTKECIGSKHPLLLYGKSINYSLTQVITTDVGQNQLWTTQFLELTNQKQMLTSGGLGTMGYGLPAAIGAKLGNPDKDVITICGDGGFQMNIQEMATAVVYELPVIICILNNGYLGNVRQWQEMFFNKRYSSTCLRYRKSCAAACNTPSGSCRNTRRILSGWQKVMGRKQSGFRVLRKLRVHYQRLKIQRKFLR